MVLPVVLCPVNHTRLKCRIDCSIIQWGCYGAKGLYQAHHQGCLLNTNLHSFQVTHGFNLFLGIEISGTGLKPPNTNKIEGLMFLQDLLANWPIQYLPHVNSIPIEIGQLKGIKVSDKGRDGRDAHTGHVDGPQLNLLNDWLLLTQLFAMINLDDNSTIGPLLDES